MSAAELPVEEMVELALEAIGDRDPERLRPLLDEAVVLRTGRSRYEGIEEVVGWVGKRYEHLERRYPLERLSPEGRGWLGRARVEYVWRESGEVGDSCPIWLSLIVSSGGRIAALGLHDDEASARAALGG